MSERESRRIIRQWDREIEDEIRREQARAAGEGHWGRVVWVALWVLWLGLLLALLAHLRALR